MSHLITRILIAMNKFVFYRNNCLVPLRILSYQESTVATRISSLSSYIQNFIFFLLGGNTNFILKFIHTVAFQDFQQKHNQWNFCTVEQKAAIFLPP